MIRILLAYCLLNQIFAMDFGKEILLCMNLKVPDYYKDVACRNQEGLGNCWAHSYADYLENNLRAYIPDLKLYQINEDYLTYVKLHDELMRAASSILKKENFDLDLGSTFKESYRRIYYSGIQFKKPGSYILPDKYKSDDAIEKLVEEVEEFANKNNKHSNFAEEVSKFIQSKLGSPSPHLKSTPSNMLLQPYDSLEVSQANKELLAQVIIKNIENKKVIATDLKLTDSFDEMYPLIQGEGRVLTRQESDLHSANIVGVKVNSEGKIEKVLFRNSWGEEEFGTNGHFAVTWTSFLEIVDEIFFPATP